MSDSEIPENISGSLAILDVGHGNCAVLMNSDGVVVIDTGLGTALFEYLTRLNVERINLVLISHADKDHIDGLTALITSQKFAIEKVRVNSDSLQNSSAWKGLIYELAKQDKFGKVDFECGLSHGQSFDFGDVKIEILGPSKYLATTGPGSEYWDGRKVSTNSVSAVIRLSKDEIPVALLPGDLDRIGLDDINHWDVDITAPFVVFPHHGGRIGRGNVDEFTREFLSSVSPMTVAFSIGRGAHGTPRPEIIEAIKQTTPGIRVVCTQLSTHCADSLPTEEPQHLNDVFAKGRSDRKCCAGSMIINLENPEEILPEIQTHLQFSTPGRSLPIRWPLVDTSPE